MSELTITGRQVAGALWRLDRVWLAFGLLFLGLGLGLPEQALESARFTVEAFLWILPFLIFSVVLAAWLISARDGCSAARRTTR